MADIAHKIGFKAPINKVYNALTTLDGLAGWWTENTKGEAQVNGNIVFTFTNPQGDVIGAMNFKVIGLEPNKKVHWKCMDGPGDWINTEVTFDLSEQDGQTILLFGHRKWAEQTESMAHCSMKWAVFLLSLKDFVLKGKGQPAPNDLKIDNWN